MSDILDQEKIAVAATATALNYPFIVNLQLDDWVEAKNKFGALNRENYHWSKGIQIVNLLGNSLTKLFGMHYLLDGRTPALRNYVDNDFFDKKWDLEADDSILYKRFVNLDNLHKDITKHTAVAKVGLARKELETLEQLAWHRETTRKMWLWFLKKRAGNQAIPNDQLIEFQELFEKD